MIDHLPMPRVGDVIKAEHIAAIRNAIKKRTPQSSPTVAVVETSAGFYMETRRSGGILPAPTTHPFLCPSRATADAPSTVEGGTVNGVIVTGLDITISTIGTKYVYLVVTKSGGGTLIASSASGWVTGFTGVIAATLGTGSSIPADTNSALYRLVATYVDGVKTTQDTISSMMVAARDDQTSTSTAVILWGQA